MSATTRAEHVLAPVAGTDDLVSMAVPQLREAVESGMQAALAVCPATASQLHEELGEYGRRLVHLPGPHRPLSGQSLAVERAHVLGPHPTVVVSEYDPTVRNGRFWAELEAAAGVMVSGSPVRLICCYPTAERRGDGLEGARAAHPALLRDGRVVPNPGYREAGGVPAPVPLPRRRPDRRVRLRTGALHEVRGVVEGLLRPMLDTDEALGDAVLALNEAATNAVEHGGQPATISIWVEPDSCIAEVHASGTLTDMWPGLARPVPGQARGWGMWIARQACPDLHVWADRSGTHVHLRYRR